MTLPRPAMRALAGVCALTLVLAGCGDDDDSGDGNEDTEQTTEASDETTESTEAEEETTESTEAEEETTESTEGEEGGEGDPEAVATAEAVNLKLEDFATGWTEEESEDSEDSEEPDPVDDCFTEADIEGTRLGDAQSPTFEATADGGNGQQGQAVSMETVVFDSPESATAVVDEVGGDAFATCVSESLSTEVLEGIEVQLAPVVDDPPVGEQSAGVAGAISITAEEGAAPTEGLIDMHVIRTGPIVSFTLTIDTLGDQTFQQTLAELYTVIADRQATEAG